MQDVKEVLVGQTREDCLNVELFLFTPPNVALVMISSYDT